jgi:2-keto-4-pentenoate hydratase/2-oxohepta-3-ene-1,7-dioic acid hydratase in catechol pathway
MRLARVLLPTSLAPSIALERDGSLYEVSELERRFGEPFSADVQPSAEDFFARVFALGGAGLDALDDRLCAGERPTEARLFPGDFLWLPPCSPERALWVQMESAPSTEPSLVPPRYHIGNARALLGHQASVPFPPAEVCPGVEVTVAALLGEELYAATPEEAERAILGYAILLGWVALEEERRSGGTRARDFAATLGSVLVTKEEAGSLAEARVRMRVGREVADLGAPLASGLSVPEALAFISQHVALSPGDIVGSEPIARGGEVARDLGLHFDATLEVAIERLGTVEARVVRGPEPRPYRWPAAR